ncbi:hypothetical protein FH972_011577 [Carpinus fangiana]|uniref:Prephenate dehydratase domain-containing protein n=1 Tax=Carpinus fangiana TaxID=176857 RepID=A0A660KUU7_9ROSI|nr:hypothetical protein FH972_011577 [Carpinus fangiana]
MAALIVRSPTTLLWSQGTSKPSPTEDKLKPTHVRYPKRLGYFPALALSLSKNSDSIFHGSFLPRVAYQVLHNVYTESVVKKVYPNWEAVPCQEISHVFEAVGRRVADVAVLPIEMCRYHMFDALLNQGLHIVGEANVAIKGHIGSDPFSLMTMRLDDVPAAATDELQLFSEYTDIITGERMRQYFRKKREDIVIPFIMLAKEPIFPVIDKPLKISL